MFPIDWLIIENIRNLDKIVLDLESRKRIRNAYIKIHNEEKNARNKCENLIRVSIKAMQ